MLDPKNSKGLMIFESDSFGKTVRATGGSPIQSSLRDLCDLGVSAVKKLKKFTHRRDAENAEVDAENFN